MDVESNIFTNVRVITKLPSSEQSNKGKVKTHNYINRQNQSTTGKGKMTEWYVLLRNPFGIHFFSFSSKLVEFSIGQLLRYA